MRTEEEIRTQIRRALSKSIPDIEGDKDTFCLGYREALYWVLKED